MMKRYEEAIAACRDTVERFPAVAKAHLSLGWAYDLAGQQQNAVASYDKAARLAPDWKKPRARLDELRPAPVQVVGSEQ
jgi:tetratricopeptide (TPR) repeat protein